MKNTSPQALQQAALKPKDPSDPKQLLSPAPTTDANAPVSAPKAAGTGLLVDTFA